MEIGNAVFLAPEKGSLHISMRREKVTTTFVLMWNNRNPVSQEPLADLELSTHHSVWRCLSVFPLQVWNAVDSGHCLQTYSVHSEAVRAARWSPCGRRILSGGFDFALHLTDLETGVS